MVTRADIGARCQDEYGRLGILRDIDPAWENPADPPGDRRTVPVAFLGPESGGREWHANPAKVRRA